MSRLDTEATTHANIINQSFAITPPSMTLHHYCIAHTPCASDDIWLVALMAKMTTQPMMRMPLHAGMTKQQNLDVNIHTYQMVDNTMCDHGWFSSMMKLGMSFPKH